MFTEYKYSPVQISDNAVELAKLLAANKPGENPAQFAAATIAERLRLHPETFLQYGPYWWAVKAALRALGHEFGAEDDAVVRAEYGGGWPAYDALVAGEQFRDYYRATFLLGTAQFWLDANSEQSYVLFDQDMEIRRLGGAAPLRVAADVRSVEVGDEAPEAALDSITPFGVEFEHEATLWRANIYAASAEAARARVDTLVASGRICGAIERSKGGAILDDADGLNLLVDHAARRVCQQAATA